jgi:hypothetical protein
MSTINYKVVFNDSMAVATQAQIQQVQARLSAHVTPAYGGDPAVWKVSTPRTDIDIDNMTLIVGVSGIQNRNALSCTRI